jgi:hypothetical protein
MDEKDEKDEKDVGSAAGAGGSGMVRRVMGAGTRLDGTAIDSVLSVCYISLPDIQLVSFHISPYSLYVRDRCD